MTTLYLPKSKADVFFVVIASGFAIFVFSPLWPKYIEFVLRGALLPLGVARLPTISALIVTLLATYLPMLLLGAGLRSIGKRLFPQSQLDASRKTITAVSGAIDVIREAEVQLASIVHQIKNGTSQLAKLKGELRALESIRDEELSLQQYKLDLIRSMPTWKRAITYVLTFISGVAVNAASDVLKLLKVWPQ